MNAFYGPRRREMGHLWRSAYLVNQAFPYTGPEWLTGLRESLPIQTRGDCLFNNRYYERGPLICPRTYVEYARTGKPQT